MAYGTTAAFASALTTETELSASIRIPETAKPAVARTARIFHGRFRTRSRQREKTPETRQTTKTRDRSTGAENRWLRRWSATTQRGGANRILPPLAVACACCAL